MGVGPGQNSNNDRPIDDRLRRTTIGVGYDGQAQEDLRPGTNNEVTGM